MEADKEQLYPLSLDKRAYRFFPKSYTISTQEKNKKVHLKRKAPASSFMDK